jgi:hypothetical protein
MHSRSDAIDRSADQHEHHCHQPTTAATVSELEEHVDGLVCLTGDEDGPLARAFYEGGKPQARHLLEHLTGIFSRANVYCHLFACGGLEGLKAELNK